MAPDTKTAIESALHPLIGLPLTIAREAADMRNFHFGAIRPYLRRLGTVGTMGAYALHVQCSWRLVDGEGIITGLMDRFVGANPEDAPDQDNWRDGNLQKVRLETFMGGVDDPTRSHVDLSGSHLVSAVAADNYGGVEISFGDGVRLQIFADSSRDEDWRFFSNEAEEEPHFVISGGKVEDRD